MITMPYILLSGYLYHTKNITTKIIKHNKTNMDNSINFNKNVSKNWHRGTQVIRHSGRETYDP